jgi:antirestriction protein ArdC
MNEMDFLRRTNLLKSQAIALLLEEIEDLKLKHGSRVKNRAMAELRRRFVGFLRPWVATMTMRGLFPKSIGRYRILDVLLIWEEAPCK